MTRVLIIDQENLGLDFAQRCVAADHEVRWFRESKKPIKDGRGFRGIQIVDDFRTSMQWAKSGLIVMTGNAKYVTELDRWREMGWTNIFGPTKASADLEIKRSVGLEAMKKAGIDVPHYEEFKSLEDAEAFARKAQDPYVFKTLGSEDDKALSFCASDPAELVAWIGRQIKAGMSLKGPCMLQEKIDMLAEVGVSGWFGPDGFLPDKWQVCFEHKKLMPGEIGPNTGEMGTVCQYVKRDPMAAEMLEPLAPLLKKLGHRGDFAIGCGIDKRGKAWPFEFTARLGWPAFYIQIASHDNDDPAEWMAALLAGDDALEVSREAAIGVVMAQPPFPQPDKPEMTEGNPIAGLEEAWDAIHPAAVMIAKGPTMKDGKVVDGLCYQTTGSYVLCVTATGKTVSKARDAVYDIVKDVKFCNALYRDDIGEKVIACLDELHRLGYAESLEP